MSHVTFDTIMKGFAIFCVVGLVILVGMGNSKRDGGSKK